MLSLSKLSIIAKVNQSKSPLCSKEVSGNIISKASTLAPSTFEEV